MKKYTVSISFYSKSNFEVQANNPQEAKREAMRMAVNHEFYRNNHIDYEVKSIQGPPTQSEIVEEAWTKTFKRYGDSGTCVMGMELSYNGRTIATQRCQGGSTTEHWYKEIMDRLTTELGYDAPGFGIEYGRMD